MSGARAKRGDGGRRASRGGEAPRRSAPPPLPAPALSVLHPAVLVVALICAVCVALTVSRPMSDTDFWEHLVIGREIWRTGRVPMLQIWTWPTWGSNLVYDTPSSWGFFALLWPFWERAGVLGGFMWRGLTTLAAFAMLWATSRRMGARGLLPLVALAWCALIYRFRAELRPESAVSVLLALQLFVHESRRAGGGARDVTLALPFIALAWANLHLSWWLGLALQAVYALDAAWTGRGRAETRATLVRLTLLGLASVAATAVNPGGVRTLLLPFQYAFVWSREPIYRFISELAPLDWSVTWTSGLPLMVALWPLLLAWRWRARGFDLAGSMLCVMMVGLMITSQRFMGTMALVAAPFLGRDLEALVGSLRWPRWTAATAARAALAGAACVAISAAGWRDPHQRPGFGLREEWFPVAACDFMQAHGVRGRGFNHFFLGGYLLWRFFPERDRLPFTDVHQAGTREDRALYAASATDGGAWRALDQKYAFDWVLLNRWRVEGDRSLDHLDQDSSFALVFLDDNAALYVRRTGPMAGVADSFAYAVMPAGLAGTARVGRAIATDSLLEARFVREATRMRDASRWNASACGMLANIDLAHGRTAEAHAAMQAALRVDPELPYGLERLGITALSLGRPREAYQALKRANRVDHAERLDDLAWQARAQWRALAARQRELEAASARAPADAALADSVRALRERLAPLRLAPLPEP